MRKHTFTFLLILLFSLFNFQGIYSQKKKEVINDSNTPLHLLQPDYKIPYGVVDKNKVKKDLDRILNYLDVETPYVVENKETRQIYTDLSKLDQHAQLRRGSFRLASYEWGVTYAAMLAAAKATGDQRYADYVYNRFDFLSKAAPEFKKLMNDYGVIDPQMRQILTPQALDDAGAVCAAMIKASRENKNLQLRPLIDNYINYIMSK